MKDIGTIHLELLQGRLTEIFGGLTRVSFRTVGAPPPPWHPRMNVYRCQDHFVVAVELAGVDRAEIDLRVESNRVWLHGQRRAPVPEPPGGELLQILALEIDEGSFEREILLPCAILPEGVRAEQRNGLLWIELPLLFAAQPANPFTP